MSQKTSWNDEPLSDRIWFKALGAIALLFTTGFVFRDAENSGWDPFLVFAGAWGNINFALILLYGGRRVWDGYTKFGISGIALWLLLGLQAITLCGPLFMTVIPIPLIFPIWIAFSDCWRCGSYD